MDVAQIQTASLGPILGGGFPVDVEEHMVVRRHVVDQAGADTQDLLLAVVHAVAVDLAVGDLLQVVAI